MKQIVVMLCLILVSGASAGQGWQPLDGAQIRAALTDRTVKYASARQTFKASGRTLYISSADSWGYWEVRGDQYCSLWPPSDLWACYDMTSDGRNGIRFIGAGGEIVEGRYVSE